MLDPDTLSYCCSQDLPLSGRGKQLYQLCDNPVPPHAHYSPLCLLALQYYGQNTKIRETLNNLILKAPQEWHTQVALPFVKIGACTSPQHCS